MSGSLIPLPLSVSSCLSLFYPLPPVSGCLICVCLSSIPLPCLTGSLLAPYPCLSLVVCLSSMSVSLLPLVWLWLSVALLCPSSSPLPVSVSGCLFCVCLYSTPNPLFWLSLYCVCFILASCLTSLSVSPLTAPPPPTPPLPLPYLRMTVCKP